VEKIRKVIGMIMIDSIMECNVNLIFSLSIGLEMIIKISKTDENET
jgi:hypothetical protein